MKKFILLTLSLTFLAASCDLGGLFDLGTGVKGVIKSEDRGETFASSSNLQKGGNINNVTVNAIAFDPTNTNTLYIASSSGIYKSTDNGTNWVYLLSGIAAADVVVDPFKPEVLYASGIVDQNGKIIKSLDAGVSWVDIYTEPSKNNTVLSINISPANSSVVLAGLNSGEIIKSTDGGTTWAVQTDLEDRVSRIEFAATGVGYALTFHKGVYKSTDQGSKWISLTSTLSNDSLNPIVSNISSVSAFYDLALDRGQAGVLYLGTEQGLFRSVNDGGNWNALSLPVRNASLRASAVAVNPNDFNNIFTAVGSTILNSANGGVSWQTKVLGTAAEVRTILIDPQMNNLIYLGLGARR